MDRSWHSKFTPTGIVAIDEAHREIERLSRQLLAACEGDAPVGEVRALYEEFRDAVLDHFEAEEELIERIVRRNPAAAEHRTRHLETHRVLRDAFAYTDAKFAEPGRAEPPNVVPLLPGKYLTQLVDLDEEMAKLL